MIIFEQLLTFFELRNILGGSWGYSTKWLNPKINPSKQVNPVEIFDTHDRIFVAICSEIRYLREKNNNTSQQDWFNCCFNFRVQQGPNPIKQLSLLKKSHFFLILHNYKFYKIDTRWMGSKGKTLFLADV